LQPLLLDVHPHLWHLAIRLRHPLRHASPADDRAEAVADQLAARQRGPHSPQVGGHQKLPGLPIQVEDAAVSIDEGQPVQKPLEQLRGLDEALGR
jgi:hypothetical protein